MFICHYLNIDNCFWNSSVDSSLNGIALWQIITKTNCSSNTFYVDEKQTENHAIFKRYLIWNQPWFINKQKYSFFHHVTIQNLLHFTFLLVFNHIKQYIHKDYRACNLCDCVWNTFRKRLLVIMVFATYFIDFK